MQRSDCERICDHSGAWLAEIWEKRGILGHDQLAAWRINTDLINALPSAYRALGYGRRWIWPTTKFSARQG